MRFHCFVYLSLAIVHFFLSNFVLSIANEEVIVQLVKIRYYDPKIEKEDA